MMCVEQHTSGNASLFNYPPNNIIRETSLLHRAVIIARREKATPPLFVQQQIHRATAGITSILQQQEAWVTITAAVLTLVRVVAWSFVWETIHWAVYSDSYVVSEKEGDLKTLIIWNLTLQNTHKR
jgi:hypothetical protein